MKLWKISKNIGGNIIVDANDLWSHKFYLEEVLQNLLNGRFSLSKGELPIVTKSLEFPKAVFVMDGHHRIIEDMLKGQKTFNVYWNEHYPYMDAGIENKLPVDKIRIVDFLKNKNIL